MLEWIRKMFTKPDAVQVPESTSSPPPPARPPATTTWQERAAAVGALVEPGQEPSYTPIGLSAGNPNNSRSRAPQMAGNPLQLHGKALADFLAQPGGVERYEAAERTRKRLGTVDGKHYSEHAAEAKRLLKAKDYKAAITLLHRLVAATESEASFSGTPPPPWYRSALDDARARLAGEPPRPKRKRKTG